MRLRGSRLGGAGATLLAVYALLAICVLSEKAGLRTNDTRLELVEKPGRFLLASLSLWNPQASLGELQNQAYGYLFPQGPWFVLGDALGLPSWITERAWTLVLLVAACEGVRRVARAVGLGEWASLAAGLTYAFAPRMMTEAGVRSAEILPTAVAGWVLLPILLAIRGRLGWRSAALLSAGAYFLSGGVNGTATVAPLPLAAIVIVWAVRTGRARGALLGWWTGLIAVTSLWWLVPLLLLNRYSPPFFDFVEDAATTTRVTGYTNAVRGADNWVGYITAGGKAWWPAGYATGYEPWLIMLTGAVAIVGLVGLGRLPGAFRTPMLIAAGLGLVCLTIGHTSAFDSPLAVPVQRLLDGALTPLRNIAKVDPVLRLPLAIGVGGVVEDLVARGARFRRARLVGVLCLGLATLMLAQPAWAGNLRTPGWRAMPAYWHQTASFLDHQPGHGRAWVIPGTGFAIQQWGWSMDEPMDTLASTPWVTRNQVPLAPPETIRMLDYLESLLESGAGSPYLGTMLSRVGIDHVLVRHDLDPAAAESTSSSSVSIALARSNGIERVAAFGKHGLGPAIEVFAVTTPTAPLVQVRDVDDVITVASGVGDVMRAVGEGLVTGDAPTVVAGEKGWNRPAAVVGDTYRRVERDFGRVHDAESAVMTRQQRFRDSRAVHDYAGVAGARPVVARYVGIRDVTATTSRGFAGGIPSVLPEEAPFSALDGEPRTQWRSDPFARQVGQRLRVELDAPRTLGRITISSPVGDDSDNPVLRWSVTAGKKTVRATVDPASGTAHANLTGVRAASLVIEAAAVGQPDANRSVAISEVHIPGLSPARTLVLPHVDSAPGVDFLFSAQPESRACIATLLGPDCSTGRQRWSEESVGIDRTIHVPAGGGKWQFSAVAIARSTAGSVQLIAPLGGPQAVGSSWLLQDPGVSPRMAFDGSPSTHWIADPRDRHPVLEVTLPKPRWFDRLGVSRAVSTAVPPTSAVITANGQTREADLTGFGVFDPIRAKKLTIRFNGPVGSDKPLGFGEIYLLPGRITVPLDGAARTGAVCGYGPPVVVDGRRYLTRVEGFMGDVVSAGPLAVRLCHGQRNIALGPGDHRIRVLSTEQFQPVSVRLVDGVPVSSASSRRMRVVSVTDRKQVVDVTGGRAAILSAAWNFNDGWRATVDGRRLKPIRVDGWSQGWLLPASTKGRVEIDYAPQRPYDVGLFGGLGLAGLVLVGAAVALVRARTRTGQALPAVPAAPRSRAGVGRASRSVLAVLVGGVLGGVPAAGGILAALVLRHRPQVGLVVGVVAAALGTVGAAEVTRRTGHIAPDWADVLTGFGAVLLLSLAWCSRSDERA